MVRFNVLSDADWETKVTDINLMLPDNKEYFQRCDYGHGVIGITVVLMCRGPYTNFKQRIRFAKAEKTLWTSCWTFTKMCEATDDQRKKIVATRLYNEVPIIVEKYKKKIVDFDADRFNADLQKWIEDMGWM